MFRRVEAVTPTESGAHAERRGELRVLAVGLALLLGVPLAPGVARAGGQGAGLPAISPQSDRDLHRFLMNEPGGPVPRYVCVDDPGTECFELSQTPSFSNNGAPTVLSAPECPSGPAAQACRPDALATLDGRVDIQFLPQDEWSYADVSSSYPTPTCASGSHGTTIDSPANYLTSPNAGFRSPIYANTPLWTLAGFPMFAGLGCAEWIRTNAADAGNTGPQLTFTLGRTAHVYVGYDADATVVPDWLGKNLSPTGIEIAADGPIGLPQRRFAIWQTPELIPKGTQVTMGGNADDGANASFMYIAIVRPVDAVEACGSYDATIGIAATAGGWDPVQTVTDSGCGVTDLNGDFVEAPIPLPGGLGWWAGDPLSTACDELFFGFPIQAERTLLTTGLLDRQAFIDAAQAQDPALCAASPSGLCQPLAMTTVDAQGNMTGFEPIAGQAFDCRFEVSFTPPGQTRVVERFVPFPQPVVDDAGSVVVTNTPVGAGIIDDLDVGFTTTANHADNLQSRLGDGAQTVLLHDRPGCDTATALLDPWFDDEVPVPPSTWTAACGPLTSTVQPIESLTVFDGGLVEAPFELAFRDPSHPGDGTLLEGWALRITTRHTECSDDIDNDGDGNVDFDGGPDGGLADAHCSSAGDDRERPNAGSTCGLGPELPALLAALAWARRRRTPGV